MAVASDTPLPNALEAMARAGDNAVFSTRILGTPMASGGWGCPHEVSGTCSKINDLPCDPGMKGCELYGRYNFFDGSKNERLRQKQARTAREKPDVPDNAPASDRQS